MSTDDKPTPEEIAKVQAHYRRQADDSHRAFEREQEAKAAAAREHIIGQRVINVSSSEWATGPAYPYIAVNLENGVEISSNGGRPQVYVPSRVKVAAPTASVDVEWVARELQRWLEEYAANTPDSGRANGALDALAEVERLFLAQMGTDPKSS